MSDLSSSCAIRQLWQQCNDGNFHDALQFLSRQATSKDMAVDLLLYSEAHLFRHQNLTADIWVRLINENLIKVKALDPKMVSRMKNYTHIAHSVTNMNQYITERWEEGWWGRLNFERVSHPGRSCSRMPIFMPVLLPVLMPLRIAT
jgi:hypothetical protein